MSISRTIRGLTAEHFGSIANLARELGWSYSKACRIVTGKQEPTISDVRDLAKIFKLDKAEDIVSVFSLS